MRKGYQLRSSVTFRKMHDQIYVMQIERNELHYFSKTSARFFEFFKKGRCVRDYAKGMARDLSTAEKEVEMMAQFLKDLEIFEEVWVEPTPYQPPAVEFVLPEYLGEEVEGWDRVAFLYP